MRYSMNLVDGVKVSRSVEESSSVQSLVDSMLNYGWEDDPDILLRTVWTITDNHTEAVKATIMWIPSYTDQPDILIVHDNGEVYRYACVLTESSYTHRRVA